MILHIQERIVLLELLFDIDKYIPLPILRKLYEELSLSDDEAVESGLYATNSKYCWINDNGREIDLSPEVENMIRKVFKELDGKGELNMCLERLYELFCGGK